MVRLYKQLFGRGPTKARTNYTGPDTLIATIQTSLTPAERNMVEQTSTSGCARYGCSTVEQITGRKVWAFVSGVDTERDVSAEVFYLEPIAAASRRSPRVAAKQSARQGGAVPAPNFEAATRTRTGEPFFTREVLYQLSYGGGSIRTIAPRPRRAATCRGPSGVQGDLGTREVRDCQGLSEATTALREMCSTS
jgi:uncharacterized protein YbcI